MSLFSKGLISSIVGCVSSYYYTTSYVPNSLQVLCNMEPVQHFTSDEFRSFKLIHSTFESPDTKRLFFAFSTQDTEYNFPVCSCVMAKYTDVSGNAIVRPYIPISNSYSTNVANSSKSRGKFSILVKRYPKSQMGNHMFTLRSGESLEFKGPFVTVPLSTNQNKDVPHFKSANYSHIGMIAGGTGITPCYQLIDYYLNSGAQSKFSSKTQLSLLYTNKERTDILMTDELLAMQRVHSNFDLYLTLTRPYLINKRKRLGTYLNTWIGGVGHISPLMIETYLPKPGANNTKILICGPHSMIVYLCGEEYKKAESKIKGLLGSMGYQRSQIVIM